MNTSFIDALRHRLKVTHKKPLTKSALKFACFQGRKCSRTRCLKAVDIIEHLCSCSPQTRRSAWYKDEDFSIHLRAFLCKVPLCCFSVKPVARFVIFVSRAICCETSISFCNHVIVTGVMRCPKAVSRADAVTLTVSETPLVLNVSFMSYSYSFLSVWTRAAGGRFKFGEGAFKYAEARRLWCETKHTFFFAQCILNWSCRWKTADSSCIRCVPVIYFCTHLFVQECVSSFKQSDSLGKKN